MGPLIEPVWDAPKNGQTSKRS